MYGQNHIKLKRANVDLRTAIVAHCNGFALARIAYFVARYHVAVITCWETRLENDSNITILPFEIMN